MHFTEILSYCFHHQTDQRHSVVEARATTSKSVFQQTTADHSQESTSDCLRVCVLFVRVDSVKMDDGLCCYVQCISDTPTIYILNFVYFPLNKLHFDSPSLIPNACICAWAVYIVIWNYQFFFSSLSPFPLSSFSLSHLAHFFSVFYSMYLLSQVGHIVLYISIGFSTRTLTIFIFYALQYTVYASRYGICSFWVCVCVRWRIFISRLTTVVVVFSLFPSNWSREFISISFIISG